LVAITRGFLFCDEQAENANKIDMNTDNILTIFSLLSYSYSYSILECTLNVLNFTIK